MTDLIKLTGLWKNQGSKGDYLSGTLGSGRVLIFPNSHKDDDKHPDYILYIAPKKEQAQGQSVVDTDCDIPF